MTTPNDPRSSGIVDPELLERHASTIADERSTIALAKAATSNREKACAAVAESALAKIRALPPDVQTEIARRYYACGRDRTPPAQG